MLLITRMDAKATKNKQFWTLFRGKIFPRHIPDRCQKSLKFPGFRASMVTLRNIEYRQAACYKALLQLNRF